MGVGENYWGKLQRRRVSRRRFLLGGGLAAAGSAALLAGCGSESPPPAPVGTAAPTEAPTSTPASATPTATPTPDPHAYRRGGTLRLWTWLSSVDRGLDPGIGHELFWDVVCSTLTQPVTYQPTKNLFAMDGMIGYEQVDPVTLAWSIRPGMKFHNGDPVNSEAVAFSFGRLAKLNEVFTRPRGDEGTWVPQEGVEFVHSFEATDDLTLTEHWRRPNADALVYRSGHSYSFLNPRVVEEQGALEGTYTAPDGTTEDVYSIQDLPFGSGSGPYVLTKRDETGTRVERWPDYHKHIPADDGFVEDGPYIEAWETRILGDWTAAKAAFLAGELDVLPWILSELGEFREDSRVSAVEVENGGISIMGMDGAKFHDRRARQALQRAFDYDTYIEAFWPAGGKYGAPISDVLPHFQPLSQLELREWCRHDPKEARALWEAAEFSTPLEEIVIGSGDPLAEFMARSLEEALGIRTGAFDLQDESWSFPPPGEPKSWDVKTGSGGNTRGTPDDSHLRYFDPKRGGYIGFNFSAESPHLEVASDSVSLTAMLEAQEQELDFDARVELLTEIQRWILDRAWSVVPLPVSTVQYLAFNSRLRDFAPDDWANFYGLRRESMWLADA